MEQQETEVILLLETLHIVAILMNTEQLAIQEVCVYIKFTHTHTHTSNTYSQTHACIHTNIHIHSVEVYQLCLSLKL